MARDVSDSTPIHSTDDLVGWIEKGVKPKEKFRIGTEHEKIPFRKSTHRPIPYKGSDGIGALMHAMQERMGWESIFDDGHLIGLFDEESGGAISLEPGGQFELSGAPVVCVHETLAEIEKHLDRVKEIADPLDIGFLTLGTSPVWGRDETPLMPKHRYEIMTRYMPKVGTMGLDMMRRTATVQVNLDFASETDMVKKLKVALALQPIATALFANSPFVDGKPSGFRSMRSEIWRHTDPARTGMLPFAFESGMGFERYAEWALDVPLYFIKRGDTYHDVAGASFRDLMARKLPMLPGERATMSDWANHLGTLFPEVRLKRYMEMRGADAGSVPQLAALPAFWVGLLYDETALDAAWDLARSWTQEERQALRDAVPRLALQTRFRRTDVRDMARHALEIARFGLSKRAIRNKRGEMESVYLDCLDSVVASGLTPADRLLASYQSEWRGDIGKVFNQTY